MKKLAFLSTVVVVCLIAVSGCETVYEEGDVVQVIENSSWLYDWKDKKFSEVSNSGSYQYLCTCYIPGQHSYHHMAITSSDSSRLPTGEGRVMSESSIVLALINKSIKQSEAQQIAKAFTKNQHYIVLVHKSGGLYSDTYVIYK